MLDVRDICDQVIPDGERLIDVNEAALRLGVSRETIRLWIRKGNLPAVKLGVRKTRLRLQDVLTIVREGMPPSAKG